MIPSIVAMFLVTLGVISYFNYRSFRTGASSQFTREELLAWRHFERGEHYCRNERYPDAIESYTSAIELIQISLFFNNRGCARLNVCDINNAIDDFSRAINLDPDCSIIWANRGIAHFMAADIESACTEWKTAVRMGHEGVQELLDQYSKADRVSVQAGLQSESQNETTSRMVSELRRLTYLKQSSPDSVVVEDRSRREG
jgi:tetratricopeptide (TPR) repeat protein